MGSASGSGPASAVLAWYGRRVGILGPGLTEFLLGSRREIAQRWAEKYQFPMAVHQRDDLPQVAQFLASTLAGPIATVSIALLYYDERIRKEAFDLQYMMTAMEQPGQQQAATAG